MDPTSNIQMGFLVVLGFIAVACAEFASCIGF